MEIYLLYIHMSKWEPIPLYDNLYIFTISCLTLILTIPGVICKAKKGALFGRNFRIIVTYCQPQKVTLFLWSSVYTFIFSPQSWLSWISVQWRTYFIKGVIKFLFLISIFQTRVAWNSVYKLFIECCWTIVNFVKISDGKSYCKYKYKGNFIPNFYT